MDGWMDRWVDGQREGERERGREGGVDGGRGVHVLPFLPFSVLPSHILCHVPSSFFSLEPPT